jgi:hypothetical protein
MKKGPAVTVEHSFETHPGTDVDPSFLALGNEHALCIRQVRQTVQGFGSGIPPISNDQQRQPRKLPELDPRAATPTVVDIIAKRSNEFESLSNIQIK